MKKALLVSMVLLFVSAYGYAKHVTPAASETTLPPQSVCKSGFVYKDGFCCPSNPLEGVMCYKP